MPTIAEDMLGILDDARGYLADEGFRRYTVTRRLRTWSEGEVGRGVPLDSDLTLSPNPKVRERDDKTIEVSHITPAWTNGAQSGGYSIDDLRPLSNNPADGEEVATECLYLVTGPMGTITYTLVDINMSDGPARGEGSGSLRYTLTLQSLNRAGPQ